MSQQTLQSQRTARLESLRKRHQELKEKISEARKYPAVDQIVLADLKKQKLSVKEEIERQAVQA